MESQTTKEVQTQNTLKNFLDNTIQRKGNRTFLSTYVGELSNHGLTKAVSDIKKSFPSLENGFYEIFIEKVKDENICDDRINDAVNHVIKTCIYPQPTIAQFLTFNKTIELFDYDQMLEKVNIDIKAFSKHKAIKLDGQTKPMYITLKDAERHNIK